MNVRLPIAALAASLALLTGCGGSDSSATDAGSASTDTTSSASERTEASGQLHTGEVEPFGENEPAPPLTLATVCPEGIGFCADFPLESFGSLLTYDHTPDEDSGLNGTCYSSTLARTKEMNMMLVCAYPTDGIDEPLAKVAADPQYVPIQLGALSGYGWGYPAPGESTYPFGYAYVEDRGKVYKITASGASPEAPSHVANFFASFRPVGN